MTWPTPPSDTPLASNHLDAATDVPSNARAELLAVKTQTDVLSSKLKQVIDNGEPMLKTGGDVTGGVTFARVAVSAAALDLATGNAFTKTIAANTTFTLANVPTSGKLAHFVLDLTNGGAFTITWWAGLKWPGGAAPTLTASGRDVLGFMSHDGGTTWVGLLLGRDVK